MEKLFMRYFVLSPYKKDVHGAASRHAITEYAKFIEPYHKKFALELKKWVSDIKNQLQE